MAGPQFSSMWSNTVLDVSMRIFLDEIDFKKKKIYLCLAVSGLSCGTWGLHCVERDLSLRCTDSLVSRGSVAVA